MSDSVEVFMAFLSNDFGKSAEDRGLKVDTHVICYEEIDDRPNVAASATITGVYGTDPEKFQRRLQGVDLNRGLALKSLW